MMMAFTCDACKIPSTECSQTRTVEKWQLKQMQNHQQWEEGIQVHVKTERPLNILPSRWLQYKMMVCQIPGHVPQQITAYLTSVITVIIVNEN